MTELPSMEDSDRSRAKMFVVNAVGFKESAAAIQAAPGMFHWPAFHMLLGFAVELSLKAFLASRGVSDRTLKFEIGHKLDRALIKARSLGLVEDDPDFDSFIVQIALAHANHEFRYLQDRSIEIVDERQALDIVHRHILSVGEQIPVSEL